MTSRVRATIQNLSDLLTKEQTEILKTAALLMVPALLTKITGLLFSLLTATQLGTSQSLNEFLFANALPEMLADILLTGAISTLVIPIFVQVKDEQGERAFMDFFNTVMNAILGIFVVVSVLVIFLADLIFPLVVQVIIRPGPQDLAIINSSAPTIIAMMRWMMIPQLILGASVFLSAGLSVYNRFLIPQLAGLFFNIGRIFGVLVLLPMFDRSPWALVAGLYVGAALHLVIQIPLARYLKIHYQRKLDLSTKYVRRFVAVAWPRLIAYSADVAGGTFSDLIIAGYNAHFISIMFYVSSLGNVIPGVIGYAFSVASFPTLSLLYNRKQFTEINRIVVQVINQIVFLALPIVVTFMILRLPVVRLVYGLIPGTSFSRQDTLSVAWTLLFISVGIVFTTGKWYLYRLFYVAQNTLIPLFVSFTSLALTVLFTILFANLLSHSDTFSLSQVQFSVDNFLTNGGGLAAVGGAGLAVSVSAIVEFIILLYLVHRNVVKIDFIDLGWRILRKLVPAGAAGVVMYFMYKTWDTLSFPIDAQPGFVGSTTLNLLILTGLTMFTCFMVYYLLCFLFGVEELKILRRILNPVFRLGGLEIR